MSAADFEKDAHWKTGTGGTGHVAGVEAHDLPADQVMTKIAQRFPLADAVRDALAAGGLEAEALMSVFEDHARTQPTRTLVAHSPVKITLDIVTEWIDGASRSGPSAVTLITISKTEPE